MSSVRQVYQTIGIWQWPWRVWFWAVIGQSVWCEPYCVCDCCHVGFNGLFVADIPGSVIPVTSSVSAVVTTDQAYCAVSQRGLRWRSSKPAIGAFTVFGYWEISRHTLLDNLNGSYLTYAIEWSHWLSREVWLVAGGLRACKYLSHIHTIPVDKIWCTSSMCVSVCVCVCVCVIYGYVETSKLCVLLYYRLKKTISSRHIDGLVDMAGLHAI